MKVKIEADGYHPLHTTILKKHAQKYTTINYGYKRTGVANNGAKLSGIGYHWYTYVGGESNYTTISRITGKEPINSPNDDEISLYHIHL